MQVKCKFIFLQCISIFFRWCENAKTELIFYSKVMASLQDGILKYSLKDNFSVFNNKKIRFDSFGASLHKFRKPRIIDNKWLLKKWPITASFCVFFVLFTFQFKWQIYNLNLINWKKHRWCAWDSNPGRQDGRCRWIHWAMAAPHYDYLTRLVENFTMQDNEIATLQSIGPITVLSCGNERIRTKIARGHGTLDQTWPQKPQLVTCTYSILPFNS